MQNITLLALYMSTFFSPSPLLMINQNNHKKNLLISNSRFSYLISNVIYSTTSYHSTAITKNTFSNFLDTPLNFANNEVKNWEGKCREGSQCCMSKDYDFQIGKTIENVNVTAKSFPDSFIYNNSYFNDGCGDIYISKCNFIQCYTTLDNGGGIIIQQNCTVILHNCIFDHCRSKKNGGAGAIAKEIKFKNEIKNGVVVNDDPDHIKTKRLDIQYTCFQSCYTTSGNGYGTALLMGADSITFFYASTVDCPPLNSEIPKGAQFDILADSVSSQFINATGGKAIYCGAMEYREATSGFFQYQTIAKMDCKYAISFTSVSIDGLKITSCNIYENSVNRAPNEDHKSNPPALVFVRTKNCIVDNFYFSKNNLNGVGIFAAKENTDNLTITLINCYADTDNLTYWVRDYVQTTNCHFTNSPIETFPLRQLNLGHCQGDMTPGQMIVTSLFTASSVFTPSSTYTKSNIFSSSEKFTKSKEFPDSKEFTNSKAFTDSNKFTNSLDFTKSKEFLETSKFTSSYSFTPSNNFTKSNKFTPSSFFSESKKFTQSNKFTGSSVFNSTKEFSPSDKFSPSSAFTNSNTFSKSKTFTESKPFTKSQTFTDSKPFSKSATFKPSSKFSSSSSFSQSSIFTPSSSFSDSSVFTNSDPFTQSNYFTESSVFTNSDPFTQSNYFSESSVFTNSDPFTQSNYFSESNVFSQSIQFSNSNIMPIIGNFNKPDDSDNKTKIIAAVAGSVGGVAIIGGLVGFFFIKKRVPQIEDVEKVKETNTTTTIDNNLHSLMDQDDPFEDDFA